MADFTRQTRIKDLAAAGRGRELLWRHGYQLGEGFSDVLSQYATVDEAAGDGRLRDLEGLLRELTGQAGKPAAAAPGRRARTGIPNPAAAE